MGQLAPQPPSTAYIGDPAEHRRIIADYAKSVGEALQDWRSEHVTIAMMALGSGSTPDFDPDRVGYSFGPILANDEIYGSLQIPRGFDRVNDALLLLHWAKTTSVGGDVVWEMAYKKSPPGGVADAAWNTNNVSAPISETPDNDTADEHLISLGSVIEAVDLLPGSQIMFRVTRLGNDLADTYPSDALLIGIDFVYFDERTGSDDDIFVP